MRVLFVKPSLAWPRTTGHDVYCYYMMKGLAELGTEVALASVEPTRPEATEGFSPAFVTTLAAEHVTETGPIRELTWLQERFRSFWGVSETEIRAVRAIANRWQPDVVVAFSLPALPYLAGVDRAVRVWAMADEWVYHHLAQVRLTDRATWTHVRDAVLKGGYERAYRKLVDRIWAVSDTDRRAARFFAGMPVADLLPNGVDTEFFAPAAADVEPATAIFWGSLVFEPNIDALNWFCQAIWPEVRRRVPHARFTMMGYQPTPQVERLAGANGVSLLPNVPDIRPEVQRHSIVVLPFLNGGGIKNKLLEAAAMGRPIVSTPYACRDLKFDGAPPMVLVKSPAEWVDALASLWQDDERRRQLGADARAWVTRHYSWAAPARGALRGFEEAVASKRAR